MSEDKDKNTITLSGKLHSDDAKQQAAQVAQTAAGSRVVANEISVEPVGRESDARQINSNLDDAIESNYKAALIAHGLDKQRIDYKAKNGLLTITGKVKTTQQRQQADTTGAEIRLKELEKSFDEQLLLIEQLTMQVEKLERASRTATFVAIFALVLAALAIGMAVFI